MLQTSCELVGGELVKFYHTKKAGVKKLLAMLKVSYTERGPGGVYKKFTPFKRRGWGAE